MTNVRKLTIVFLVILWIGYVYLLWNSNIEYYSRYLALFNLVIYFFISIFLYQKYKQGIENCKGDVLLDAKEKWDFLYQDVWVSIYVAFLSLFFGFILYVGEFGLENISWLLVMILVIYPKIILRNRIIVNNDEINFSKYGHFSKIKFRLINSIVFNEDEGKIKINHKKVIPSKHGFLSSKTETLDMDGNEELKDGKNVFRRRAMFKKDWIFLKALLEKKHKEFDFEFRVVY